MNLEGDLLHTVQPDDISASRKRLGRSLFWGATALVAIVGGALVIDDFVVELGFTNWRPLLYAYILWAVILCAVQVIERGEMGKRALFVLPAALFVISMVVFPLLFGLSIAFSDWNLSSLEGQKFNGFDNVVAMWNDAFYWNALKNMVYYVAAIAVEYAIAFGLALLLNADIRARKFFRVAIILPLMLSPVAVSWMVGKSMMEIRFGPVSHLAKFLGWDQPAFFSDPMIARLSIMVMDAWTWIPLMVVILLAGLQAMDKEVQEAAKVDGANPWQSFWSITFPLMIPVSVTAILIRIIFKLKLADIIINVTSGGPGGATDSVTSFIFREYRDRSNVGYGTMLAIAYLVLIVVAITLLLALVNRLTKRPA
ncbi:MAG: sugar ABC transporter permease [Acuticoccus sp.]